jgi:chromosome segregation ATPase
MRIPGKFLLLALIPVAVATYANEKLYRYMNEDGVVVIDFSIPPKFADKGYEVLSPSGRVLETVAPKQSDEMSSSERKAAAEEQKREDLYILRSYSSVDDVNNARKRRLSMLDYEIDSLSRKLEDYQKRRRELSAKAASYQAAGKQPPESTAELLKDLEDQSVITRNNVAERRKQYQALNKKYDYYAVRLVELRGPEAAGVAAEVSETAPSP